MLDSLNDANPLHDWAKAAGSIYQAELQRLLSLHLGVQWGPGRNDCREMVGFRADQLRAFSKRTVAIEAELEASGASHETTAARMRADDAASVATRPAKDHSLTPTLLAERWEAEGRAVGLENAAAVEAAVVGRQDALPSSAPTPSWPGCSIPRPACAPTPLASARPRWSSASAPPRPGASLPLRSWAWPRTSWQVARSAAERSLRLVGRATADLERAEAHLGDFGPLSGLRRSGRLERRGAEHALTRAAERLEMVLVERRASEHKLAELEAGEAKRLRFAADHGWRAERVEAIDAELDRHWATATLAAVRQDDPLAFGIDRLRGARAVAAADLATYRAGLPPDRSAAVTEAKRTLAAAEHDLRQSRAVLVERRQRLALATERHWGRRDKVAVAAATRAVERAEVAVTAAVAAEVAVRSRLDAEVSNQLRREAALGATEPRRTELAQALAEIDAALDDSRGQRVTALSAEAIVPAHLAAVVGRGALRSWSTPSVVRAGLLHRVLPGPPSRSPRP